MAKEEPKSRSEKIRARFRHYRQEIASVHEKMEKKDATIVHLKSVIDMMAEKCSCKHPLHIMNWGEKGDRFIMACDNIHCQKYRQPVRTFRKSVLGIKARVRMGRGKKEIVEAL